ncbi:MAG: cation transporter [Hylemonella sp.]|nr:cation transporter [Hylemonella sp.]
MKLPQTLEQDTASCCACNSACSATPAPAPVEAEQSSTAGTVFRIPTMDCASEEGEIRNALADIAGVRSLGFQLSARTLRIDAPADVLPSALDAIRRPDLIPNP